MRSKVMTENIPLYATAKNGLSAANDQPRKVGVRVARSLTDIMQVVAIRASVFMSDQTCPYEEDFDGNDFCATHLIGYMGNKPAACIRARLFADFCTLERLAMSAGYRKTRLVFHTVPATIEL